MIKIKFESFVKLILECGMDSLLWKSDFKEYFDASTSVFFN